MTTKVFYQRLNQTRVIDDAMFSACYHYVEGELQSVANAEDVIARLFSGLAIPANYLPVAVLNTSCLDTTYRNTQNIDESWCEADIVDEFLFDPAKSIYLAEGRRSSMIGDIFLVDGVDAYVVARVGFVKLYEEVAKLLEGQA
jgi:hypothetical protein